MLTTFSEKPEKSLLTFAWVGTLLASFLTNVTWKEIFGGDIETGFYIRLGLTLILLLLTFVWSTTRPLRGYWVLILALILGDIAASALQGLPAWQAIWSSSPSWFIQNLGVQLPRLLLTLFAWITLILMGMKRRDYFFVMGQLDAPNEPIPWLGEKKIEPWTIYGRRWAISMFIVALFVIGLGFRPSLESLGKIVPLFPAILIFAILNSFNENFASRASLLPQLLPTFGKAQSLLLPAVFFGMWHYYGFPPGTGMILPIFLGWVSAKAMVETKGFFWSWAIQVPLDVIVFSIYAVLFVS
jgi:hypothetical protein